MTKWPSDQATKRTRTYSWEDPALTAAGGLETSGLEFLMAMTKGSLPLPPILSTLDIKIKSVEAGKVEFTFIPQEFHYNPIGTVHGGMITAILDSAMGCSVHSLLPKGKGYTTLELKVNFLKSITINTGELTAIGKMIHAGSRTSLVEAQIVNDEGKIFAHAVSTCLIMNLE